MKCKKKPLGKLSQKKTTKEYSLDQLLSKSSKYDFVLSVEDKRWLNGSLVEGESKR
ncbi:hypothetical protein V6D52_13230 [Idiomarina loihiensis]|jgi:hypothetical protein|uniref:hypothetical protein n=1 Tax=Idiomarina TaxID=135575 RepID=UPI00088F4825|nr:MULTISPECIES: hypothetical protein [Idiomarina]SDF27518.1 hypothetical protein SAMN04515658_10118 [Idiomarina zobellii]|tara:strand:- start:873 stop:1040 length:168 start_codon:yes stop_codon:yes gene_type:complete